VQILCTQGGNKKKLICKGRIKKNITGEKTNLLTLQGVSTYLPIKKYNN
jgi:hypothetical protein